MTARRAGFGAGMAAGAALGAGVGVAAALAFLGTGPVVSAASAPPQAAQAAQPAQYSSSKVVLENDRVRVKDALFAPGVANSTMHTHDLAHVGVVIEGGTLVFKYPDGKSETMELTRGGVGFREAHVTHQPVNTGQTVVRVIEVELK